MRKLRNFKMSFSIFWSLVLNRPLVPNLQLKVIVKFWVLDITVLG